jgi:hypothetical protein
MKRKRSLFLIFTLAICLTGLSIYINNEEIELHQFISFKKSKVEEKSNKREIAGFGKEKRRPLSEKETVVFDKKKLEDLFEELSLVEVCNKNVDRIFSSIDWIDLHSDRYDDFNTLIDKIEDISSVMGNTVDANIFLIDKVSQAVEESPEYFELKFFSKYWNKIRVCENRKMWFFWENVLILIVSDNEMRRNLDSHLRGGLRDTLFLLVHSATPYNMNLAFGLLEKIKSSKVTWKIDWEEIHVIKEDYFMIMKDFKEGASLDLPQKDQWKVYYDYRRDLENITERLIDNL